MNAVNLKNFILSKLEEKKAEDIKVFDAKEFDTASYVVLANGKSIRNVSAIADYISHELKNQGMRVAIEGLPSSSWAVLDANSVLVHIFHPETRNIYNLEEMFDNPSL